MEKKARTTIIIPDSLMVDLKIMCALTHRRMGDFIRIAIKDKIKDVRNNIGSIDMPK